MEKENNINDIEFSIVSPVYKAELLVDELVARITAEVTKLTDKYEIILVEDCGPDNSWGKIKEICERDTHVKGIKLSRNFGQHYAITAGLDYVSGEWIVVMDCDLQDQPEEISNLYRKACEGYEIVYAQRINRQDNLIKRMSSFLFYNTLKYLTGIDQDHTIANFGIYNKKVITATSRMREKIRYFPSMIKLVGFRAAKMQVVHAERKQGKTSYNLSKLLRLATDIILAYSDKPLRIAIKVGFTISLISFLFALRIIYLSLTGHIYILGYASLMTSIWFLGGILILLMGVIGLYIGKIFEGVKDRPLYIVDSSINL